MTRKAPQVLIGGVTILRGRGEFANTESMINEAL